MSVCCRNSRNATEYIDYVKAWRDQFGVDGVYSDYGEVRMLRELFPAGSLIFHDTMHRPVAEFRPFLHTYATATLMAEGVKSDAGIYWQWPKAARQSPSSPVRFLPVSQYLLELASGIRVLECGVLNLPRGVKRIPSPRVTPRIVFPSRRSHVR